MSNWLLHYFSVSSKWRHDRRKLPLTSAHRGVYNRMHRQSNAELGSLPNLIDGCSLNDKIQWLKLFDQDPNIVRCQDKIRVRDHVTQTVGSQYLPELYQVCEKASELNYDELPSAFVLKTNNDSGTVFLVRDKMNADLRRIEARLTESLLRPPYGWYGGEWAYEYIPPKVFAEQLLEPASSSPPADYKFHCAEGKVCFVHYLYNRSSRETTKEQVVSVEGRDLDIRLSIHFDGGKDFQKPDNWEEMIQVAEKLSRPFKYVRVDLYNAQGQIFFGELTFWPHAGVYRGQGQSQLGPLVNFDRTTFRPPFPERG